jgi:hypothetical protein
MVFKRLPGSFGADGPSVDTASAAGPVRPGGPPRGGRREIQLTPAMRRAHAAEEAEVALSANPNGPNGVLEADERGGLFPDGHDTPTNAEVDAWIRQVSGRRARPGARAGAAGARPGTGPTVMELRMRCDVLHAVTDLT